MDGLSFCLQVFQGPLLVPIKILEQHLSPSLGKQGSQLCHGLLDDLALLHGHDLLLAPLGCLLFFKLLGGLVHLEMKLASHCSSIACTHLCLLLQEVQCLLGVLLSSVPPEVCRQSEWSRSQCQALSLVQGQCQTWSDWH